MCRIVMRSVIQGNVFLRPSLTLRVSIVPNDTGYRSTRATVCCKTRADQSWRRPEAAT